MGGDFRQLTTKKYYYGIDIMKYIMSFCIVAIHLQPFNSFLNEENDFSNIAIRLAVPFYFCCSGFFLKHKLDATNDLLEYKAVALTYIKRVLRLYLIWSIIYLPCIAFWYIKNKKTPLLYIKEILFDGSYLHLWYLPSLAVGIVIVSFLYKKMGIKLAFALACILYVIGLFDTVWYKTACSFSPDIKKIVDAYNSVFITSRNGIFFGFMFLMVGFIAAEYRCSIQKSVICYVISMCMLGWEFFIYCKYNTAESYESFVLSVPAVFFLFLIARDMRIQPKGWLNYFRIGGVIIYFVHCWVDFTFSILSFNILHRQFGSMVRFGYTLMISFIISIAVYKLQKKNWFKWLRKLY